MVFMQTHAVLIAAETGLAYGRGVAKGIVNYANLANQWSIALAPAVNILDSVRSANFAGVIVQAANRNETAALRAMDLPVVNIGDMQDGHVVPTVFSDHRAIATRAVDHLRSRGLKHLAFSGPDEGWYVEQRRAGFLAAVEAAGLGSPAFMHTTQAAQARGAGLVGMLKRGPHPLGVFAAHDFWARLVVSAALEIGLRVPEDVAVVGVDNDELVCETSPVPLSSVAVAAERIGFEAATLLDRMIKGEQVDIEPVLVPPQGVVVRQSSDLLAIEDPNVADALRYITEHAHRPISVEDILDHLTISRRQLEKRFQTVLGRSPATEIRRARIEKAKHLMDTTDLPLTKIAERSGFHDVSFLGKSFRRETGMTPTQYRRRTRPSAT
jgi:LacI family transcriptional regulator